MKPSKILNSVINFKIILFKIPVLPKHIWKWKLFIYLASFLNCSFLAFEVDFRADGVAQVLECLPRKWKALSSNPVPPKNKQMKLISETFLAWDSLP
jgi:hypothetical protein